MISIPGQQMAAARDELYQRAVSRVERSPRLRKYKSIILSDGFIGHRHLMWVVYATVKEIESWAQQIKEDSDG